MKALSKKKLQYIENKHWEEYKREQEEIESKMTEEELKIYRENQRKKLNSILETTAIVGSMINNKY